MPAGVTPVEMSAERGGPAARDRAEHAPLLHAEPRMLLEEGVTLRVEDIGHLHRRPAHAGLGFRFKRDRWRTTGVATCSCSRGFGAACKCVATGGDTPWCARGRRDRAGPGSSAGPHPLPGDAWRTNVDYVVGDIGDTIYPS